MEGDPGTWSESIADCIGVCGGRADAWPAVDGGRHAGSAPSDAGTDAPVTDAAPDAP